MHIATSETTIHLLPPMFILLKLLLSYVVLSRPGCIGSSGRGRCDDQGAAMRPPPTPAAASSGAAVPMVVSRRSALSHACRAGLLVGPSLFSSSSAASRVPAAAAAVSDGGGSVLPPEFRTSAYEKTEYTNSRPASRHTNLSPLEAYDVLRRRVPAVVVGGDGDRGGDNHGAGRRPPRALDVGAGAGVSTRVLWEMGYRRIDAVDWSDEAWKISVVTPVPGTVRFYARDDDAFFRDHPGDGGGDDACYDVIVYNFAVNADKATRVATRHLCDRPGSVLLAPVNDAADYWYKQSYVELDAAGRIVWKSAPEVGAWSVQFQPDVTSDTCVGIWCGAYNGYDNGGSGGR